MGISWSSNSRRRNSYLQNRPPSLPPPPPPPAPYYYHPESHPLPLLPPPQPQGYFLPSTTPYAPPPPPPPPQSNSNSFYYSNPNSYGTPTLAPRFHFQHFYQPQQQPAVWPAPRPAAPTPTPAITPPYVDHQTAKKIRTYVNVHKDTLCLEVDEHNPDHHLLSFVFDAVYDGSITILYFAKEEEKCSFVPLYPDAHQLVRIPFQKGVGQKFAQPSGTGIDLGFFELDDLSKPSSEDVFPLVICAETSLKTSEDETPGDSLLNASPHMQITQGILEKSNGAGSFPIKVVRQILWIDGVRYELRELYGIGSSSAADFNGNDPGKECVICLTEPKDTAILPCRHMCMCSDCANDLRQQSNKCPLCRQPIEELIEIKVNSGDQ